MPPLSGQMVSPGQETWSAEASRGRLSPYGDQLVLGMPVISVLIFHS
jgi:hypothetical protein